MDINKEIFHLVSFLSHPAGFDVDICGSLCIRPISEESPPKHWEVDWEEYINGVTYKYSKEFDNLKKACEFFVQKRHQMYLGLDLEQIV